MPKEWDLNLRKHELRVRLSVGFPAGMNTR